jgi:leucine efflux protein
MSEALGITDFAAFLLVTTVTILLPGPNSLFVLSVAARQGVRDGYRAAVGVFMGDGLLMLASVAGLAPLLKTYPQVFTVLKLAGAAYLAWMGLGLVRAGWRQWAQRGVVADVGTAETLAGEAWVRRPFRRTLGICLLNPKAILFFMAFFIQFVRPDAPHPALAFAVLGAVLTLISASYLSLLILAGSRLATGFRARRRLAACATGTAGLLFIGFGGRLATASL